MIWFKMDVDVDQYRMTPKEEEEDTESRPLAGGARPATYMVPNLVSLLLSPMSEAGGGGLRRRGWNSVRRAPGTLPIP